MVQEAKRANIEIVLVIKYTSELKECDTFPSEVIVRNTAFYFYFILIFFKFFLFSQFRSGASGKRNKWIWFSPWIEGAFKSQSVNKLRITCDAIWYEHVLFCIRNLYGLLFFVHQQIYIINIHFNNRSTFHIELSSMDFENVRFNSALMYYQRISKIHDAYTHTNRNQMKILREIQMHSNDMNAAKS